MNIKNFFIVPLFAIICTTKSFGTGIDANTTNPLCDNDTLSKYNGTANIEIDWAPNVINLSWYDGDTKLNVPVESQSCVYDGAMVIPTQPTKTGYTFKGWVAHADPSCGLKNVDTDINAADHAFLSNDGTNQAGATEYELTQNGTWATPFNYGIVYGRSMCSISTGTHGHTGTPDNTLGKYCWCQLTGYKKNDSPKCFLNSYLWVSHEFQGQTEECQSLCALNCTFYLRTRNTFRTAMYGAMAQ